MQTIETHVADLEAQLAQCGAKLDELVTQFDEVEAVTKAERRRRINALKTKQRAAQVRLDQLKAAGSPRWTAVRGGLETAWSEVALALKKHSHQLPQKG
jgi:hypothetical protein